LIHRGAEAGVALEPYLPALDGQRFRNRLWVTAPGDVAVGGGDPGLIDATAVRGVVEGHELNHHRWRAMVFVSIGIVAASFASVTGPSRVGWIR
jgi:hypothetical protein